MADEQFRQISKKGWHHVHYDGSSGSEMTKCSYCGKLRWCGQCLSCRNVDCTVYGGGPPVSNTLKNDGLRHDAAFDRKQADSCAVEFRYPSVDEIKSADFTVKFPKAGPYAIWVPGGAELRLEADRYDQLFNRMDFVVHPGAFGRPDTCYISTDGAATATYRAAEEQMINNTNLSQVLKCHTCGVPSGPNPGQPNPNALPVTEALKTEQCENLVKVDGIVRCPKCDVQWGISVIAERIAISGVPCEAEKPKKGR